MLLIDSLYINMGGGKMLLDYLCRCLIERGVEFMLLKDERCGALQCEEDIPYLMVMRASLKKRRAFYKLHRNDYTSVFCFGNVPPSIRLIVPVYTYFHNVNMLTLQNCRDWEQKMKLWLKRMCIKSLRRNTDEWFVQTSNTAKELVMHLGISDNKVKLYPFYNLPVYPLSDKPRTDYIFAGEYSGSKGHTELLEAWRILHKKRVDLTLHLTVSLGDEFLKQLDSAIRDGVKIINHGYIPVEELAGLYMQCKATVYPSYNESFGLGLVEAMESGCDVIASNRSFVYAICEPSEVFEPSSPISIAETVIKYENSECRKTKQLVQNKIDEIINLIIKN